jgi:hypothetical protein
MYRIAVPIRNGPLQPCMCGICCPVASNCRHIMGVQLWDWTFPSPAMEGRFLPKPNATCIRRRRVDGDLECGCFRILSLLRGSCFQLMQLTRNCGGFTPQATSVPMLEKSAQCSLFALSGGTPERPPIRLRQKHPLRFAMKPGVQPSRPSNISTLPASLCRRQ